MALHSDFVIASVASVAPLTVAVFGRWRGEEKSAGSGLSGTTSPFQVISGSGLRGRLARSFAFPASSESSARR
ncbi:hypothetical protein ADL29_10545 [Streptomyces chattanoogensis]|uniref:Uncharacterized protein n=1 Tax=Streptomyces chattanoogensis TaxID=66876 RepID=A0A0N0H1M4_9ACTN|nr:hypothetical protein ADL29_10545 [Streptomyces chattanoogensis]